MKIVIIGIGAMGSLFAGRLLPLAEVVMLGNWPEQLVALKEGGLRLIQPDGREMSIAVRATNDLKEAGSPDLVLVLVKGWQTYVVTIVSTRDDLGNQINRPALVKFALPGRL